MLILLALCCLFYWHFVAYSTGTLLLILPAVRTTATCCLTYRTCRATKWSCSTPASVHTSSTNKSEGEIQRSLFSKYVIFIIFLYHLTSPFLCPTKLEAYRYAIVCMTGPMFYSGNVARKKYIYYLHSIYVAILGFM